MKQKLNLLREMVEEDVCSDIIDKVSDLVEENFRQAQKADRVISNLIHIKELIDEITTTEGEYNSHSETLSTLLKIIKHNVNTSLEIE